ncbi:MAG: diphosphate--fructose-6-phosphate 1-phosphotransferase, partial [Lentisphaerae bacterium]
MYEVSPLQKARYEYRPKLPKLFQEHGPAVRCVEGEPTESVADQEAVSKLFANTYGMPIVTFQPDPESDFSQPIKVGVVLSGGQAPGGHNVIAGLYDALKAMNPANELYGFIGGPSGLIENKYIVLDDETVDRYRNTGGFDIIGSGRTKLEKEDDFAKVVANCRDLGVSGIVI